MWVRSSWFHCLPFCVCEGGLIKLDSRTVSVPARELPDGSVVVTLPRLRHLVVGLPLTLVGAVMWASQFWGSSLDGPAVVQLAIGVLCVGPGIYAIARGLEPRPKLVAGKAGLSVSYGLARFERELMSLKAGDVELGIDERPAGTGRFFVLQLRIRGQEMWLSVVCSRLRSEVENARAALEAAMAEH